MQSRRRKKKIKKMGERLKGRDVSSDNRREPLPPMLGKKKQNSALCTLHVRASASTICKIAAELFPRYSDGISDGVVMTRALSVPDQPTNRGEPINELVANICQVVAPTPRSLNDRFQFLSAAFRESAAH